MAVYVNANCMDWAKHRRRKAAAKCHLMLDAQTFLPRFAFELSQRGVLWVTRPKENMAYRIVKRLKNTNKSILLDAEVELTVKKSRNDYPERFRLIIANVERDGQIVKMEFITDDFSLAASTIALLYKSRWDTEECGGGLENLRTQSNL